MNKNLISWLLYDAANSFPATAIGSLFLGQWLILDKGLDEIWYGGAAAFSTILLLIIAPLIGAWSDSLGKRLPFIKIFTYLLFVCNLLFVLISIFLGGSTSQPYLMLIVFFLFQLILQLSLIPYNSLLETISNLKNRGEISGLGDAFGNSGWIISSAILLPFAQGNITLIGLPGRTQVFLPTFIFFIILSLPMLFLFKEKANTNIRKTKVDAKIVYKRFIDGLKNLFRKDRNVAIFLVAFSFVSDAILTIQLYFAIVLDRLYMATDSQKFIVTLIMFISMIIGGFLLGKISDRIGCKKIIITSCISLATIFSIAFFFPNKIVMYSLPIIAGVAWGGFYVSSRALLVKISPPDKLGEYFGFYSTFWRFASIVGPIVWSLTLLILKNEGTRRYTWAGFSMVILIVIGTYILSKVEEQKYLIKN